MAWLQLIHIVDRIIHLRFESWTTYTLKQFAYFQNYVTQNSWLKSWVLARGPVNSLGDTAEGWTSIWIWSHKGALSGRTEVVEAACLLSMTLLAHNRACWAIDTEVFNRKYLTYTHIMGGLGVGANWNKSHEVRISIVRCAALSSD